MVKHRLGVQADVLVAGGGDGDVLDGDVCKGTAEGGNRSTIDPHSGQNRAPSGTFDPQAGQNMHIVFLMRASNWSYEAGQ